MSTSNQAQLRASRPASVLDADTAPRSDDASGPWPAPAHTPTEMVPIEHEASERVVRTLVFVLPPAALGVGGWLAWGGTLHWQDLLVLAITYTLTGLGHHRRLSPAVHPPQLQDHPRRCARCWRCSGRWRSRGR